MGSIILTDDVNMQVTTKFSTKKRSPQRPFSGRVWMIWPKNTELDTSASYKRQSREYQNWGMVWFVNICELAVNLPLQVELCLIFVYLQMWHWQRSDRHEWRAPVGHTVFLKLVVSIWKCNKGKSNKEYFFKNLFCFPLSGIADQGFTCALVRHN